MKCRTLRPPEPVRSLEFFILGTGLVVIFGYFVRRCGERFWTDECLSAIMVNDPSFPHMLAALRDEINAMPPLPFVCGWFWSRVFGGSEWSLRMPSALCLMVAVIAIWGALRRLSGGTIAAVCAVGVPLMSTVVRRQMVEARPYTLLLAAFSVCVYLLVIRGDCQSRGKWDWRVIMAHAVLVACHHLGGLYSSLVIGVALLEFLLDRDEKFLQFARNALVGWVAVLPSIPFYLAQRRLGGEFNWLTKPGYTVLVQATTGFLDLAGVVVVIPIVVCFAWLALTRRRASEQFAPRTLYPRHVMLLLASGFAFPLLLWIESQVGLRLFLDRYLIVQVVYCCFLIAYLAEPSPGMPADGTDPQATSGPLVSDSVQGSHLSLWTQGCLFSVVAASLFEIVSDRKCGPRQWGNTEERFCAVAESLPALPVLIASGNVHEWYVLNHYRADTPYFLIDPAFQNRASFYGSTGRRKDITILDAWVRHYVHEFRIRDLEQFCASHREFLLLDRLDKPPFPCGIEALDEQFAAKTLVATRLGASIWRVSRHTPD